jgi:hypothetical protein
MVVVVVYLETAEEVISSQNAQHKNCSEKKVEEEGLAIEALVRLDHTDGLVEHAVDPRLAVHVLVSQADDQAELTLREGLTRREHELEGALALRLDNLVKLDVGELFFTKS